MDWKNGDPSKKLRLERYVEWCLLPKGERPAQKALAEELGVTEQTLRNYRREPEFQQAVVERLRLTARVDRLPDVLQALYDQATDINNPRSVAASKLLLDFGERSVAAEDAKVNTRELTSEELVAAALDVLQRHVSTSS